MKAGARLKSAVCDTEAVVIRCEGGTIECGGVAMGEAKPDSAAEIDPEHAAGTQMGKRYVDDTGTCEVLCVKPGKGSLALDGKPLAIKSAKPLPASD